MTKEVRDLIAIANWAVELLGKQAHPYNHEYTCSVRLVEAIGAVERAEPRASRALECLERA